MPQRILALDISDSEVKAAVLETTFRDYRLAALHRQALADGDVPADEQVRRFVADHLDDADTVLTALPGDRVTWRTFYLPFRDRKRLNQTVPFELESSVPFGLDEVIVDFQALRRDGSGTTVLAALVPKRDLERHLELLREAGADPKIVDLSPLTTLNALSLVPDLPPGFAFLDCSGRSTTVALYRDGELAGLRTVIQATALSLSSNGASASAGHEKALEDLVAEVRWTLLALNGAPLEAGLPCFVAGPPETVKTLRGTLEEALDVEVRPIDGLRLPAAAPDAGPLAPAFASSIGLALREVSPTNAFGVNFRRGEFTFHRTQVELRRALRGVAALVALVVALWVTQLYMEYRQLADRAALIDEQIEMVVNDALGTKGRLRNPREQLASEVEALRDRVALLNDVVPVSTSTSVDVLRAISSAIPNQIRVDSEEYSMDADAVRLRANTDTFESVDAIKQHLLDTGFFRGVQVKDAKAAPDGNGVDFRMVMELDKNLRSQVKAR
jgi:general secretion pathway protein L